MDLVQTVISEEKLNDWCRRLPECEDFLQEFFSTCSQCPLEANQFNYIRDVMIQTEIDPTWSAYKKKLIQAFNEIAYHPGELN